ncbi:C39 family peptidase [Streptomyces sp. NPDC059255]|uniref:C39 family peptidase n=1 Tax=Streptomyces sp. NPDC059255 TaxID=3346793 RepID=UPI0036B868F6
MTGSSTTHPVPYYAQWESAGLVPEFISGTRPAASDPLWRKSGAATAAEYGFWAPRICGMACLRMALDHWGHRVPPSVPLLHEALEAGAYVRSGETVKGLIYDPFAEYVTRRWGLHTRVRPRDLTHDEIRDEIGGGRLVMLSVHRTIRTLEPAPPQRGGHLVLAVGADPAGVALHNPSGFPGHSQQFARVPWTDLDRFFAGRGIILGDRERGARSS